MTLDIARLIPSKLRHVIAIGRRGDPHLDGMGSPVTSRGRRVNVATSPAASIVNHNIPAFESM
jgi:hypothetical protein